MFMWGTEHESCHPKRSSEFKIPRFHHDATDLIYKVELV
jgi:hypothetical protein